MEAYTIRVKAARYFLLTEWTRMRGDELASNGVTNLPAECPAIMILYQILDLLDRNSDSPPRELAPAIRRLLQERTFIDENGDSCVLEALPDTINREIQLIIGMLEQFRSSGISPAQWRGTPVTPIMFG